MDLWFSKHEWYPCKPFDASFGRAFSIGCLSWKGKLMVHRGFLQQYLADDLHVQVNKKVDELLGAPECEGYGVVVVGHSLGGALAHLCAYELATLHPETPVDLITFGSVGNPTFARAINDLPNLRAFRVQNEMDIVTRAPLLNYRHAGHHIWMQKGTIRGPSHRAPFGPSSPTSYSGNSFRMAWTIW